MSDIVHYGMNKQSLSGTPFHLPAASGLPGWGGGPGFRNFRGSKREINNLLKLAPKNQNLEPDDEYVVTHQFQIMMKF